MRRLVAQTTVHASDLIAPLFVREGIDAPVPINSLPGVVQHTRDSLRAEVSQLAGLGVGAVMLFGVPATKDATGSGAFDPDGIAQLALSDLRAEVGDDMVIMADLCVDEYTDHGHCGILDGPAGHPSTSVDNDATLEVYGRIAVAQADAGAHVVAPSGMMDGQVGAIRAALDAAGHTGTAILAYSAKYASGLYGPFRDAVDCQIVPVTNPEGETYTFGLGFTDVGTGVGCVDTDEGRRLVGLDASADEGNEVAWSRTVVELDGTKARNGATTKGTFSRPDDDAAIELLRQVTCGDLTIPTDGLTLAQR